MGYCKPTLVGYLLRQRSRSMRDYFQLDPCLLHEALAVWMRGGGNDSNKLDVRPLAVLKALVQAGADVNTAIWEAAPLPGMEPHDCQILSIRVSSLPCLRRGDSPLAWALHCLAEINEPTSPTALRVGLLVPLLVW